MVKLGLWSFEKASWKPPELLQPRVGFFFVFGGVLCIVWCSSQVDHVYLDPVWTHVLIVKGFILEG